MEDKPLNLDAMTVTQTPLEFAFWNGVVREDTKDLAKQKLGECYEDIIEVLLDYMDIPRQRAELIALWIIGTYYHKDFNTYPILFFNAMRGSGKTRMLKLISSMSANGDGSIINNITDAVLFRHPKGTILCIDEMESIASKEKNTLRELLNASYKKGVKVRRIRKVRIQGQDQQVVESFEPYFPVAMANIFGLEEVLSDRAITLILEKSNHPRITKMAEDFDSNPKILQIKRTLNAVMLFSVMSLGKKDYMTGWNQYLRYKYNDIITSYNIITYSNTNSIDEDNLYLAIDESGINGRNLELTLPLLLIAKSLNEDVFKSTLNYFKEYTTEKKEDEFTNSRDVSLYQFVAECGNDKEMKSLKEITSYFRLYVGDTENDEERWVNEKWLGRALKRLCLIASTKRVTSGRMVVLDVDKAKEKIKIFGEKQ